MNDQMRQQMAQGATTPSAEGPPEFKFTQPGEEVFGQVLQTRFGLNTQHGIGNLIEVQDQQRGPMTLWLGNVQLETGLVQGRNQVERPVQAGDVVYIRYEGPQSLDGGKTLKVFGINVAPGQQPAPQPAQGSAPAQVPAPVQQQAPQPQPQQQWQQPQGQPQQWPGQQPAPQGQAPQQAPQQQGEAVPF